MGSPDFKGESWDDVKDIHTKLDVSMAEATVLKTKDASLIANRLKAREFDITGTRGWNEADFTAGGVDTAEVNHGTLESKIKKGLYFAGEILDVDGSRGGYNLAWAWASGYVAGQAASGASI